MPRRPRRPVVKRRAPGAPALRPNVAELRALAHPLRLRILELFTEAPRTTKQVADLLGQPPTRLYHHVAALERAGLLVLRETRKNRGAVEKWYESVSRMMGAPSPLNADASARRSASANTRPARNARRAVAATVMEQARQELLAPPRTGEEPPLVVRLVTAGPPAMIAKIRQRLYGVVEEIRREFSCDDEAASGASENDRWAVTMAFAPVWPRRPARGRTRSAR